MGRAAAERRTVDSRLMGWMLCGGKKLKLDSPEDGGGGLVKYKRTSSPVSGSDSFPAFDFASDSSARLLDSSHVAPRSKRCDQMRGAGQGRAGQEG